MSGSTPDRETNRKTNQEITGSGPLAGSAAHADGNGEGENMPVFTFSRKTATGEKVQGERVASTKDGLASQLRRERITPGSIREKGKEFSLPTFGSGKVKVKDVAVFFRQFSVMIDAGL